MVSLLTFSNYFPHLPYLQIVLTMHFLQHFYMLTISSIQLAIQLAICNIFSDGGRALLVEKALDLFSQRSASVTYKIRDLEQIVKLVSL